MARSPRLIPDDEGAGRFLPWVVAVMAFLASLAIAGTIALDGAMQSWRTGLEGNLTIEVPAGETGGSDDSIAKTVEALRATAGVREVRVLGDAEMAALLEPWLGPETPLGDLPVPRLIDVELDPEHAIDFAALARRLDAAVPGVRLDDHRSWLEQLIRLARSVQLLAAAIVVLIALAMAMEVIFAVRAALAAHERVVALLHQIGATDAFVAREFQNHAFFMGVRGGLIGLALSAITLFALAHLATAIETPLIPRVSFPTGGLAIMALVPPISGAIALLTARLTVLRALGRMP